MREVTVVSRKLTLKRSTLNWRRGFHRNKEQNGNQHWLYKQFPEFDIRKDPETVYARFVKYAERFKNDHLKAYNITDKAQQRSLFLDSIGEATLDVFEQLSSTGTDLDGAVNALRDKFKESQNRLYNIHKFRCVKQGKDETWDSFISKLKAEGEHCDLPAGWLDTEVLMAMIESGKSKRVLKKKVTTRLANTSRGTQICQRSRKRGSTRHKSGEPNTNGRHR